MLSLCVIVCCVSLLCVAMFFLCDVVCAFMCVSFVCGVLCCWLLFHWFGVRVCGVAVALRSCVFLCCGLNDSPACECIVYTPSLRCSSFFWCDGGCLFMNLFVMACICCLLIHCID